MFYNKTIFFQTYCRTNPRIILNLFLIKKKIDLKINH